MTSQAEIEAVVSSRGVYVFSGGRVQIARIGDERWGAERFEEMYGRFLAEHDFIGRTHSLLF